MDIEWSLTANFPELRILVALHELSEDCTVLARSLIPILQFELIGFYSSDVYFSYSCN